MHVYHSVHIELYLSAHVNSSISISSHLSICLNLSLPIPHYILSHESQTVPLCLSVCLIRFLVCIYSFVRIYFYMSLHLSLSLSLYIYICVCVCVCVYVYIYITIYIDRNTILLISPLFWYAFSSLPRYTFFFFSPCYKTIFPLMIFTPHCDCFTAFVNSPYFVSTYIFTLFLFFLLIISLIYSFIFFFLSFSFF